MTCRSICVNTKQDWDSASLWLKDRAKASADVEIAVREILDSVKTKGDAALIDYTIAFDCESFTPPLAIDDYAISLEAAQVPAKDRDIIYRAADNIRSFHERQKENSWFTTRPDGTILGQRVTPVDAVGLYVPGGQGGNTPLISTLLMNAIPAQTAGVKRIAICTPPRKDGSINPHILAAAHILNIQEIYRVGGAWSIGALAYGTESIAPVDVIAGPGNIYVTTAKRLVQGTVGIDMIAGPSEVLVICDGSADLAVVAADLLSQAEHDPMASCICITTDAHIAEDLPGELARQAHSLPRAAIVKKSLEDWGAVILAQSMSLAIEIANTIAPEHLELYTRDPWSLLPFIKHAGAIFMGANSPEPLGDYYAGPNHVLPTMGTARFSQALSVQTFCKKTSIIAASRSCLQASINPVATLARIEGLEAHARALEIRRR
ncbi:MAG: histidinol dehydrogenase [Desulfovibrio sp.]|nr:histidinol dehydrogenase [Desulfovibrio sp.]